MESMYAIIDETKKVITGFVGNVKDISEELLEKKWEAVQITIENSPAPQHFYWNGKLFVKELNNV
jgi:acetylglutamate kinase